MEKRPLACTAGPLVGGLCCKLGIEGSKSTFRSTEGADFRAAVLGAVDFRAAEPGTRCAEVDAMLLAAIAADLRSFRMRVPLEDEDVDCGSAYGLASKHRVQLMRDIY